jgi:hypothetical protein
MVIRRVDSVVLVWRLKALHAVWQVNQSENTNAMISRA